MLKTLIQKKQNELADIIRILIYKEDATILTKLNLDDDQIFLEPLLMAYFNRAQTEKVFPEGMLPALMQGYVLEKQETKVSALSNKEGIAYVPTVGYIKKEEITPFDELHIIPTTNIEVIKYNVPLLENILHIVSMNNPIQEEELVMNEELFNHNIIPLTNAVTHLKQHVEDYFSIIEMCLKKCAFFKLKGRFSRSFASINANGIIYFAIPDGKDAEDEVYFIDTLGTFTGKILHTTLFHNQQEIFKINHRTRASEIIEGEEDRRNVYTLFNNLLMNVTAMMCLESCLDAAIFTTTQKHDAKIRMALHLKKYEVDIKKMEAMIAHFSGLEHVFVTDGIEIYNFMTNHAENILKNNAEILEDFDFSTFHYQMDYSEFSKINS